MKSGKFSVVQTLSLILGVGIFIILIALSVRIYGPAWNKGDKGAKAYFKTLEEQIGIAEGGGTGEFSLWQPVDSKNKREFFLIYFGDKYKFSIPNGRTFLFGGKENGLCICFWDGENGICDYCKVLDFPIKYKSDETQVSWDYGPWAAATGEKVTIKKIGGEYEFVKSK